MSSIKESSIRRAATKRRYSCFEPQRDPYPLLPASSSSQSRPVYHAVEHITRFLVSQGIPYETVGDEDFQKFIRYFQPQFDFPTSRSLESLANRIGNPGAPHVLTETILGPVSLSVDVVGDEDEKFLAFSIHYFEDFYDRKNVVFLRKMFESQITEENVMSYVTRAVSHYGCAQIKFTNLVAPNPTLAAILRKSHMIQRDFVCFYHYVSRFVSNLLNIKEFRESVEQLRNFVRFVRSESALYAHFRRLQLNSNGDVYLPPIDTTENWLTTVEFVTGCNLLHDTLKQFAHRYRITGYIANNQHQHLLYLQRILHKCSQHAHELSGPLNSISQIVPAIVTMRNFLVTLTRQYRLEKTIREAFALAFEPLTGGINSKRLDIATLLDPRFGFRLDLYSRSEWAMVNEMVIQEFCDTTSPSNERKYHPDVLKLRKTERARLMTAELDEYYKSCTTWRPADDESPFYWWGLRPTSMALLPVLAREYLACPAVTIDADHYFGDGGKFRQLCRSYHSQTLENCLNIAGFDQQFRGRGANRPGSCAPPSFSVHEEYRISHNNGEQNEQEYVRPTSAQDYHYVPDAVSEELIIADTPEEADRDASTAPEEEEGENEEREREEEEEVRDKEEEGPPPLDPKPTRKRPCAICQNRENTRRTSQESEKILVLITAVFRDEMSQETAESIFSRSMTSVFCRAHFSDAARTIFEVLRITEPKNIALASEESVEMLKREAHFISGQLMDPTDFRNCLFLFTCKFSDTQIPPKRARRYLVEYLGSSEDSTLDETQEVKPDDESEGASDGVFGEEEEEDHENSEKPHVSRRKPCNRRCKLCNSMESPQNVKFTAMRKEKLLVMLAAVQREEVTAQEACTMLERVKKPYFCKLHFVETADDVLQILGLPHPVNLNSIVYEKMEEMAEKMRTVFGERLEMYQLKYYLEYFLGKYYKKPSSLPMTSNTPLLNENGREKCCFCSLEVSRSDLMPVATEAIKFSLHIKGIAPFDYICRSHVACSTRGRGFLKSH